MIGRTCCNSGTRTGNYFMATRTRNSFVTFYIALTLVAYALAAMRQVELIIYAFGAKSDPTQSILNADSATDAAGSIIGNTSLRATDFSR